MTPRSATVVLASENAYALGASEWPGELLDSKPNGWFTFRDGKQKIWYMSERAQGIALRVHTIKEAKNGY